jgi:hypothetical protein
VQKQRLTGRHCLQAVAKSTQTRGTDNPDANLTDLSEKRRQVLPGRRSPLKTVGLAGVAQLVERNLAMVEVASSNLVPRSTVSNQSALAKSVVM